MQILKTIFSFFLDIVETVVVAMAVFVVIYLFFFQPHQVIGNSMLPNFYDKEYILTDKISYRFRQPQRGDVVVFKAPEDEDKDFIKRIIAVPSERIKIVDGKIFINGAALPENYLDPGLLTPPGKFLKENEEITVSQDSYIVLGDNRLNSSDSRSWGFVTSKEIIGRALLVYWPPSRFGLVKKTDYR